MTAYARRYQRGWLRRRRDSWSLSYRVDEPDPVTGRMARRRVTLTIGSVQELRTELAARAVAQSIMDRITGRAIAAGTAISASKYLRRYLAERVVLMRPSTQGTVRSRIEQHISPALRGLRLDQVTPAVAQTLVAQMARAGRSAQTVRQVVKLLRAILRAAQHEGFAALAFEGRAVRYPSQVMATPRRRSFERDEIVRLLNAAEHPWRAAFALGAYLGLRCGETLGLDWQDLDLQLGTVRLRQAAVRGRLQGLKTARSAALLPMPGELTAILADYRNHRGAPASGLLFVSRTGKPLQSNVYRAALSRGLRALQIDHAGTHAFRHGAASLLLADGAASTTVRDLMRHHDVKQTDTYAHAVRDDLRRVADRVSLKPATP